MSLNLLNTLDIEYVTVETTPGSGSSDLAAPALNEYATSILTIEIEAKMPGHGYAPPDCSPAV